MAIADGLAAETSDNERPFFYYELACYLDQHGKPEKAVLYWKKGAAFPKDLNVPSRYAEPVFPRGIKPEDYLTESTAAKKLKDE